MEIAQIHVANVSQVEVDERLNEIVKHVFRYYLNGVAAEVQVCKTFQSFKCSFWQSSDIVVR